MDGLRFVAISLVVLFHLNAFLIVKTAGYETGWTAKWSWFFHIALQGNHGVELFFVISGFILALPFAAHYLAAAPAVDFRKYYLRRLTRLEPPYFATILLLIALTALMHSGFPSSFGPHLFATFFYLHNLVYGAHSPIMGVGWSLEIEIQFYLLVPLVTRVFAIRNPWFRRGSLVALAGLGMAARTAFLGRFPRLELSILSYAQFFVLGLLLADIFLVSWRSSPARSYSWDLIGGAAWVALLCSWQWPVSALWAFPPFALVAYCAAFRGRISQLIFSNRWISAIGGMCYSIYLIHYEVISAVGRFTKRFGAGWSGPVYLLAQFAMIAPAILLVCGLYFVLLEKPCMRREWPERLWMQVTAKFRQEPHASETFAD